MDDDEPITLSALEHFMYCPRQAALIHVDGVWADNRHTVRGQEGHRRADAGADRRERGREVLRGLRVWSDRFGLTGRCDVVEIDKTGAMSPVEYKIGTRHGRAAQVQLCAQGLCLEEMFSVDVVVGHVWYAAHRHREEVALDDGLRSLTIATIERVRQALSAPRLPHAPADERCNECQLRPHCLPSIVADPSRVQRHLRELLS